MQLFAALGGAAIGAALLLFFGVWGDSTKSVTPVYGTRAIVGGVSGAVLGAIVGCGLLNGFISSFLIWTVGFAMGAAVLGPGCDADPVSSAVWGTMLGAFCGLTKGRGCLIVIGALLGLNLGAVIGSPAAIIGLFLGALLGVLGGYGDRLLKANAYAKAEPREEGETTETEREEDVG